jgi:hypothetical protein
MDVVSGTRHYLVTAASGKPGNLVMHRVR